MSAPEKKTDLNAFAASFAERLVKAAREDDPKKEAQYQAREAARDAQLAQALERHRAARKK